MSMRRSSEQVRLDIIRLCHAGLEPLVLLDQAFSRMRRAVPVDTWFCATMDPATLLYTGALRRGFPSGTEHLTPMLMHNEFLQDDVNKFAGFARGSGPAAGTLYTATGGVPERSLRYRDIFAPVGLGDELRGTLKAGSSTWGGFCLHRELAPSGFSEDETVFLQQLAPHLGEGIRAGLALSNVERSEPGSGPGLAILSDALDLLAVTPAAEGWLTEIGDWSRSGELPETLLALAVNLQALERAGDDTPHAMPRTRVRTHRGRWLTLHASRLAGDEAAGQIAIIFELARPVEVAPLLLSAYALTPRETELAQLVLQGWSTEAIVDELCISALTVQQHLKAVFEKAGVRSRRELVAQVFHQQYVPRLEAGERPDAGGSFDWRR